MDKSDIEALSWFHAIDFGDVRTPGRLSPSQPPNWTLYGLLRFLEGIDLTGMSVLDLGTMDGLMAFIMKDEGASEVVATDLWDRQQFRMGRSHLGWDEAIEYRTPLDISDANAELGSHRFDVVVFAGVLYHLMCPLDALIQCRLLLKERGLLLLETCYDADAQGLSLTFNQGMDEPLFDEPTTYFLPSASALEAMMRTASLEPLATMRIGGGNRLSILARAARPSQVTGKTALQMRHDRYVGTRDHFAFGDLFWSLEEGAGGRSLVEARNPPSEEALDIRAYRPSVRFQPRWTPEREA